MHRQDPEKVQKEYIAWEVGSTRGKSYRVQQKQKNFQKYKGKDGEVGLLTTVVVEPWRVDELLQSHELRNRRAGCLS